MSEKTEDNNERLDGGMVPDDHPIYQSGYIMMRPIHGNKKTEAPPMKRIKLFQGDITTLQLDAIVNAANKSLLGGGGVDGAIHRAAGKELLEACRKLKGCDTGKAKITPAFALPSQWVIHTVGPVYSGGFVDGAELLASCYRESLKLAVDNDLQSIAFPAISTGVFGYPRREAAQIAVAEVTAFLEESDRLIQVIFCVFDDETHAVYEELLA
jgi:O-acetyl-ADP-ribose deacetylase (regulator of RNase III)